jgi:ligand-binding sensor domain-containing protein
MGRFPLTAPPFVTPAVAVAAALVALAVAPGAVWAQKGVWRQIALPGAGANAVAGGDSGSVLAVSTAGLFRYDGLRVQRVPIFSTRSDSLDGSAVIRAGNGDVWLGTTDQGLFRLRPDGAVERYTAQNGIGNSANDEILVLAETPDGAIWAGTNRGGLSRFDGAAWTTLTTDHGLPSMNVKALAVDPRDGSLWAGTLATGTDAGLVHVVDGAVAAVYDQFALTPNENVFSVTVTRDGDVWVGHDVGIARLTGAGFEEVAAGVALTALAEGAHGELWFGTSTRGVGSLDGGAVGIISGGPPSNTVLAVHCDPAGVLWVATTGGLSRFEGAAWRSYSKFDLLPSSTDALVAARDLSAAARGDSIDGHGIVWIGGSITIASPTQNLKLVRRANGRLQAIGTAEGLPTGSLRAIALSDSGAIWCATAQGAAGGGVARVRADGVVARVLSGSEGFPSVPTHHLADAGNGAVWATTRDGAFLIERSGFRALPVGPGRMPDASLTGVAVEPSGRVWFATGENANQPDGRPAVGAVRFDPADSSFVLVGLAQGMPTDTLAGVTVAPNGDVWFASREGAIRWRDGAVRTFRSADGLNSSFVSGIGVAPDGSVWVATAVGIARFDGTLWSTYNVADGLAGGVAVRIFADSLGVIASCGPEGASLYHPDRTPPRVEILGGPPAATGSSIVQFAVRGGDLDSDASRVSISSELVGRAPTPFAEDVTAITLDLPDGEYEFRVRGKDRALNDTTEPFTWRFAVDATPPRPVVQQPAFNAVVRDTVYVLGTVADPRFAHYVVELRPSGAVAWDTLFTSLAPPPAGTPLFAWTSRDVNDGSWELRVGVEDSLGLIGYAQVSVIVDNFAPSASVTAPAQVDHVQGGSVFTTDGEVELYLPPNAFIADQIVRIEPLPGPVPFLVKPAGRVLGGWTVRANQLDLAKPATLSMLLPATEGPGALDELTALAPRSLARLEIVAGDTTLVAIGGALSADGTRLTASVSRLGTYVIATGVEVAAGFAGPRALDCQPRVLSPRGGGFDVRTAISFELGRPGTGAVKVYDRAGRLVKELVEDDAFAAGSNVVYWDGTDGDGEVVPSGLYTVAVRFDGKTAVRTVAVANR